MSVYFQTSGAGSLRGPLSIAHLRKVRQKRGKTTHLRKVGRGSRKRKRGHRRYRGPWDGCPPSEGEQKMREICTPSEGGKRQPETETRAQALQRASGDCVPSEGEQETRENHTPSEGGKRQPETETRAQALQRASVDCAPSEGEQKTRENHTPPEGGKVTREY